MKGLITLQEGGLRRDMAFLSMRHNGYKRWALLGEGRLNGPELAPFL